MNHARPAFDSLTPPDRRSSRERPFGPLRDQTRRSGSADLLRRGWPSLEHVCELSVFASPGADLSSVPDLLLEVPHGATRRSHYETIRHLLRGDLPEDLIDFFFVNTDAGSSEVAKSIAELVTGPISAAALQPHLGSEPRHQPADLRPRSVLMVRCLIPRTFIDTNRVVESGGRGSGPAELSPAIPDYVRNSEDAESLLELHARYRAVAEQAYELVCGSGGLALTPHTYAPKAVSVESFDEGIGQALREAYRPEKYEQWDTRPPVDIIDAGPDGVNLAPPRLVEAVKDNFARVGIQATENVTYPLHPSTMSHYFSARYPGQVLCFEIARDLLAEPFAPFEEMSIADHKVAKMSAPIAAAVVAELARAAGLC